MGRFKIDLVPWATNTLATPLIRVNDMNYYYVTDVPNHYVGLKGIGQAKFLIVNNKVEKYQKCFLLKENNLEFDIAFTSVLKRAIKTLYYIQEQLDCHWLPVVKSWRLNERHYGALQGLHKSETAEKYGEAQVKLWRRSYDVRPPPLDRNDERWPGKARQYAAMDQGMIPTTESLKDTIHRTLPCWYDQIVPAIKCGKKVLIIAHGNSLRGIIKYLDKVSDDDIVSYEVPTGIPMVYELDEDLQPVKRYYLASDEEVAEAQALIANQGKIIQK